MKKFKITFTETVTSTVTVFAEDEKEAEKHLLISVPNGVRTVKKENRKVVKIQEKK